MRPHLPCLLLASLFCFSAAPASAAAPPPRPVPRIDAHGDALPPGAIARLGTGRFRVGTSLRTLSLSPDGKTIASYAMTSRSEVVLSDAASGREVRRLAVNALGGRLVEFTPNGKELLVADLNKFVRFYDPIGGRKLRQINMGPARGNVLVLSGDGRRMAATSPGFGRPSALFVFDLNTRNQLASMEPMHWLICLALSPDGMYLASCGEARTGGRQPRNANELQKAPQTVQLWATGTGKEIGKIECGLGEQASAVAFAPDNKTLAVATTTGIVQLWDFPSRKQLRSWRGPMQTLGHFLRFSPDGKTLLVASSHGRPTPAVWDVTTGRRLRVPRCPEGSFVGAAFLPGGRILACGLDHQTAVLWDLLSGKTRSLLQGHHGAVTALTFRGDGQRVFTTSDDRRIIEWDLAGKRVRSLPELRLGPSDIRRYRSEASEVGAFSPGGAYLATCVAQGSVVLVRDVEHGEELFTLPRSFALRQVALAFSPDGKFLATPSGHHNQKNSVRIIRLGSSEDVLAWDVGGIAVASLAFDATGKRLAVAIAPPIGQVGMATIRLYRLDLKREDPDFRPASLPATFQSAIPLTFSPDGALLAAGGPQGIVHLFDARTGREIEHLPGIEPISRGPVFSPDGRTLAVATSRPDQTGHTLVLWEMCTNKIRFAAELPVAVTALAFAPTGKVLATGLADSSTLLWDITGQRSQRFSSRTSELWDTLASADAEKAFEAQRILAAGGDAAVAVLRRRIRPAAGKALTETELARLVKQLDDDEFEARRKAFAALAGQGKAAVPHLNKALKDNPSVEAKRRIDELLAKLGRRPEPSDGGRSLRAVEVLEWIGTPAAKRLVERLAGGHAGAALTLEARGTLRRMAK
jgi:WD40 repeat protein